MLTRDGSKGTHFVTLCPVSSERASRLASLADRVPMPPDDARGKVT